MVPSRSLRMEIDKPGSWNSGTEKNMLQVGDIVENTYKILTEIGQGGMSTVYLAINIRANKQWAIKEVRKDGYQDGELVRETLIAEAKILKKVKHKHLPSIVDIIDKGDTFLVIMDYIEGDTLRKRIRKQGAQPEKAVINWALQICDVLDYLHSQKPPIIYRDTKPSNIMLKPDGTLVLIDFGTAREYKDSKSEDTIALGTRGYAAPEQQAALSQTDQRTDIYNLGATMYHLLTGRSPARELYGMRPIREIDPTLSEGTEYIVSKCIQPDPADRYQSAKELMYDLSRYGELEEGKRKKNKRIFVGMCISLICSILFLTSGIFLHRTANSIRKNTYDTAVVAASSAATTEESTAMFKKAIQLAPEQEDAYVDLLDNIFLSDGIFSKDEANSMTDILGTKQSNSDRTNIEALADNQPGYDRFCYDMGLAFFYYYEDTGNKSLSAKWFEIAAASQTLSEREVERAKMLYKIASYYSQMNNKNKAGDNTISYTDYWNDLTELSSGNIAESDNIRTALVMYKELVTQVIMHSTEFKEDGITKQQLVEELDFVDSKLDEISMTQDCREEDIQSIEVIKGNIKKANKTVETTYQERE